jgi:transcriptional/translational regulatory protein YebC/TACO1
MAGHSKWAGIKHKKAIVDARRGKLFTKLARAITVAAKEGGGDVDGNPSLALAVQKAKDASMPKDNIERAIAKGTGEGSDADALETVLYEGYGPGGVALLVVVVDGSRYGEDDLLPAIEAGALDVTVDDDVFEVLTEPSDLTAVRAALEEAGVELESAEVVQYPKTRVPLDEEIAGRLLRLIDALEDNDDVGEVHGNFDVDAEVLERVAG